MYMYMYVYIYIYTHIVPIDPTNITWPWFVGSRNQMPNPRGRTFPWASTARGLGLSRWERSTWVERWAAWVEVFRLPFYGLILVGKLWCFNQIRLDIWIWMVFEGTKHGNWTIEHRDFASVEDQKGDFDQVFCHKSVFNWQEEFYHSEWWFLSI